MKIAHVLSSLNAGGIEKWLCHYTIYNNSQSDSDKLYYVINSSPEKLDFFEEDIIKNGGEIKRLPSVKHFLRYFIQLFIFFRKEKFDVVHAHSFHFSGAILFIAYLEGVKIRVAHSHNATIKNNERKYRKIYKKIMRLFILLFATSRIAVSKISGEILFDKASFEIVPCGLSYLVDEEKLSVLNLPELNKKIVISHVGSFTYEKNHEFIFKIARYMNQKMNLDNFVFLFIGEGPLKDEIFHKFQEEKIPSVFLSLRNDINEIHKKYTNIFLFPSLHEGLGLASIEAQAQGVRCIHSTNIPDVINKEMVTVLATDSELSIKAWANKILKLSNTGKESFFLKEDLEDFLISKNYSSIRNIYKSHL